MMGNRQQREADVNGQYYTDDGYYQDVKRKKTEFVHMLDEGAKNDASTYHKQYSKDALDDPKKDKNWAFYDDRITNMGDREAAKITQMHQWFGDYAKLERYHDYIQWLFPLHDPSLFNKKVQLLQRHEVRSIRRDKIALARIVQSYKMMLDFFGFVLADERTGRVDRKTTPKTLPDGWKKVFSTFQARYIYRPKEGKDTLYFPGSAKERLYSLNTPGNHNFRRISRILKCIGEMGLVHYQLQFLLKLAEEIYGKKTLTEAQDSFEKYWKVFLIGEKNRRQLDDHVRLMQGLAPKESDDEKLVATGTPSFRVMMQRRRRDDEATAPLTTTADAKADDVEEGEVARKMADDPIHDDDDDDEDDEVVDTPAIVTPAKFTLGLDITILLAGVKATQRNWVGLYKKDQLDETVGNRALAIPPVPGSEAYRAIQELQADLGLPSRVRQALALQRRHIAHFVPQFQKGRKVKMSQIKPCEYGTHSGISALVITQPNADSVAVPGSTFAVNWIAAPYAPSVMGGSETVEVVVVRTKPRPRKVTIVTKKANLFDGSFKWDVPEDFPEGEYFLCVRQKHFGTHGANLEFASPLRGMFKIRKPVMKDLVSLPPPVALAARVSAERSTSASSDEVTKEKKRGILTKCSFDGGTNCGVDGSILWPGNIGPWEPGTYEFRYFDSGWDATSDTLLFVPARGPVATSRPFVIPKSDTAGGGVAASAAKIRVVKPLPLPVAPDPKELASYKWKEREPAHFEELAKRRAKRKLIESEKIHGLVRMMTRVEVRYKGKWYRGEFSKSKIDKEGVQKFAVQCDQDQLGTLTWCALGDIKIVKERMVYDDAYY